MKIKNLNLPPKTISNIRMNKTDEVLKTYHSDKYSLFSDELKSKIENYLFNI